MQQEFKKVIEASYLTAEKAWSYRAILRYFYIQHELRIRGGYDETSNRYFYDVITEK